MEHATPTGMAPGQRIRLFGWNLGNWREQRRVQSWEQIDLAEKVETVRRKTRPWKAIIALAFAIAAATFATDARKSEGPFNDKTLSIVRHIVWPGSTIAFCAFGCIVTYEVASKTHQILEPRAGESHAAIARYALLIIGGLTTLVLTLDLFGVPIGQLVLGGALTSVFVGIAAQQALSNVFAGLVLLFAHPFRVGDNIRLRAGALGGQLEGIVADIGITYVKIDTGGTVVSIPNSQVLNAVVGPVPPEGAASDSWPGTSADTPATTVSPASAGHPNLASTPPGIAGAPPEHPAPALEPGEVTGGTPDSKQAEDRTPRPPDRALPLGPARTYQIKAFMSGCIPLAGSDWQFSPTYHAP
jgi:hypothetical protein